MLDLVFPVSGLAALAVGDAGPARSSPVALPVPKGPSRLRAPDDGLSG